MIGDIARPDGIGRLRREVPVEQIWRDWNGMFAIRGFDELATGFAVQTEFTHQSGNSTNAVMMPLFSQFNLNPRRSIAPFMLIVDVLDQEPETLIVIFSR